MERRDFIAAGGVTSFTIGFSGCSSLINRGSGRRLWFILIENWGTEEDIEIEVIQDDEIVFKNVFSMPAMPEDGQVGEPKPTIVAGKPHVRFINATWEMSDADWKVKYRIAGDTDWKTEDFDSADTEDVGVKIRRYETTFTTTNNKLVEFESRDEVDIYLNSIESEIRNHSAKKKWQLTYVHIPIDHLNVITNIL